jgi:hypothetical protein
MPTTARRVVVFDASPKNDPTPWMRKACKSAGVLLADISAIADLLAADPTAQKLLVARGPVGEDKRLAPHYRAALDKLAGGAPVVAVHSVVWIDYGIEPVAVVLDFDNLELERAKGLRLGMTGKQYDELVAKARGQMEQRVKALPPARVLVLPAKASDAKKAELAAAHIKKFAS